MQAAHSGASRGRIGDCGAKMSGMGAGVNRVAGVAMVSGVLVGTCALGYGVTRITRPRRTPDTAVPAVVVTSALRDPVRARRPSRRAPAPRGR